MFGLLGESYAQAQAANDKLAMEVEYAVRSRYRANYDLQVTVHNRGDQPIPVLMVDFSRDYIDGFSPVSFMPSVTEITSRAYTVRLTDIPARASRAITVEMQSEDYGQHLGLITASADGLNALEISFSTFIFP